MLDPQLSRPEAVLKGDRDEHLTARELEILQMIVDGKSNKEIATGSTSAQTPWPFIAPTSWTRSGIHKTAELVVYAIRNGLVNLP